jgi:hypothetical protein
MRWSTQKSVDFILVKKPTITLKQHFFDQLMLFEDYIKKKFSLTLSKDWTTKGFSCEEQTLANTYLNTLQKKTKSPRGSTFEKPVDKQRVGISWSKKIKHIIPIKYLSDIGSTAEAAKHSEVISSNPSQTRAKASGDEDAGSFDAVSQTTQKRQFNVILKSRSMKTLENSNAAQQASTGTPAKRIVGSEEVPYTYKLAVARQSMKNNLITSENNQEDDLQLKRNASQPSEVILGAQQELRQGFGFRERQLNLKLKVQPEQEQGDARNIKTANTEFGKHDLTKKNSSSRSRTTTGLSVSPTASSTPTNQRSLLCTNPRLPAPIRSRTNRWVRCFPEQEKRRKSKTARGSDWQASEGR